MSTWLQSLRIRIIRSIPPPIWRILARPNGVEWAAYLKIRGQFASIGHDVSIVPSAVISDPELISIGNNVTLSTCALIAHDGSAPVIGRARGRIVDAVGPIRIGNDCFVGYGAIILPNVRLGDGVIVAAGAVVTRDVPAGMIVAGIPAREVSTSEAYGDKLENLTQSYPWRDLLSRSAEPGVAAEIKRLRQTHFDL